MRDLGSSSSKPLTYNELLWVISLTIRFSISIPLLSFRLSCFICMFSESDFNDFSDSRALRSDTCIWLASKMSCFAGLSFTSNLKLPSVIAIEFIFISNPGLELGLSGLKASITNWIFRGEDGFSFERTTSKSSSLTALIMTSLFNSGKMATLAYSFSILNIVSFWRS